MKKYFKMAIDKIMQIPLSDRFLIVFMLLTLIQITISLFDTSPTNQFADSIDVALRTSTASIFGYFISANFVGGNGSFKSNIATSTQKHLNKNNVKMHAEKPATPSNSHQTLAEDLATLTNLPSLKIEKPEVPSNSHQTLAKDLATKNNSNIQAYGVLRKTQAILSYRKKSFRIRKLSASDVISKPKVGTQKNIAPSSPRQKKQLVTIQTLIVGTICLSSLIILFAARKFATLNIADVPILSQLRDIICGSLGFLLGIPPNSFDNN